MPAERRPSAIAGHGLFADGEHPVGTAVAVAADQLNHSCDPTCGWGADGHLVALRDVAAGDELTVDYATSTTDPAYVLWCHCDTYRCRQVVEGTDWRIPQLQRRYAGHWAPAVQALINSQ